MDITVLRLLAILRVIGLVVTVAICFATRHRMLRGSAAVVLLIIAALFTQWSILAVRRRPELLITPWVLAVDIAIALALTLGDSWIYGPGQARVFPSLGWIWPLATVATVAIATSMWVGSAIGMAVGLAHLVGVPETRQDFFGSIYRVDLSLVPSLSLVGVYALIGVISGPAMAAIRRGAEELGTLRARDEIARTIHDSALQALVLVQQRSEDPTLVVAAATADRDLRAFLSSGRPGPAAGLRDDLDRMAAEISKTYGFETRVFVADDTPVLRQASAQAMSGAVREAVVNAARHAKPRQVVVYVEPDGNGQVFASVRDDGAGFDPTTVTEGFGTRESIRNRIVGGGGQVEITSAPGQGTEVRLWLPA